MEHIKAINFQIPGTDQEVTIRSCTAEDQDKLIAFYNNILPDELMHFDEDVTNSEVIFRRLNPSPDQKNMSLLAITDGVIISVGTLMRRLNSRSAHVGKIMLYVSPEYRKAGVGSRLLKKLYQTALQQGIEKLYGTIPETSFQDFSEILERFGFRKEAVLRNHLKDSRNRSVDLVIIAQDLNVLWEQMVDWQSPYGRAMEY